MPPIDVYEWLYRWGDIDLFEWINTADTEYTIEDCRDWNPETLGF